MEEIKQISQKLELEIDRVRVIASDLRELLLSKDFLLNKMFKVCEMSCALNLNVEDLQESLDEINKTIRSNEAAPAPKSDVVVKKKYNLKNFESWFDRFVKALKEQELKDRGASQEQQSKILGSLDVLEKEDKPIYPISGPGLYEYLEAAPKKEFKSGHLEVKQEVDRILDRTWNNENGVNYQIISKYSEKDGYKVKVFIYLNSKSISTAEECIDIITPIVEKLWQFKWLPVNKIEVVVYVSKDSFNNINSELIKQISNFKIVGDKGNWPLGLTEITSSCSEKYIILNNKLGKVRIEASRI